MEVRIDFCLTFPALVTLIPFFKFLLLAAIKSSLFNQVLYVSHGVYAKQIYMGYGCHNSLSSPLLIDMQCAGYCTAKEVNLAQYFPRQVNHFSHTRNIRVDSMSASKFP